MAALGGSVVLFGGVILRGTTYVMLDDTWQWDGNNWQQLPPMGPPGRSDAAMAAR
jgi:hypothetical protein